jgi:putative heme-binding domain-containing protein
VAHCRLLTALEAPGADCEQQIHFFLCLRFLRHEPWSPAERQILLNWYVSARAANGGGSYLPFLEAIFAEMAPVFTEKERRAVAEKGARQPQKLVGHQAARGHKGQKHTFDDLLTFLDADGVKRGDRERGRVVFEKADCLRCHRHGNVGGGLGPDLITLARRFTRRTMLEAIVYPSKDISDQYRAMVLVTNRGVTLVGQVSSRGDKLVVQQSDGRRITLRKKDVEDQYPSPVSPMPEGLLDGLSKNEIADLFAFLESSL